jgi:pimeloyl-ACP methyl ester carboxylesterase
MSMSDGTILTYALVLPPDFNPAKSYPVLLALPPGAQTRSMVDAGLDLYWRDGAYRYGWIVVSPAAPNGTLFFRGSETLVPEFLDQIMAMYPPEGGQFHLAGISNGGLGAFRVAINNPDRFASLIGVPGFPPTNEDFAMLERLVNIPVALHVGETDTTWLAEMERTEAALAELGGMVSLTVAAGEGHVIQSLVGGDELFAFLEAARVK